jgi:hypothetical protein
MTQAATLREVEVDGYVPSTLATSDRISLVDAAHGGSAALCDDRLYPVRNAFVIG